MTGGGVEAIEREEIADRIAGPDAAAARRGQAGDGDPRKSSGRRSRRESPEHSDSLTHAAPSPDSLAQKTRRRNLYHERRNSPAAGRPPDTQLTEVFHSLP